ncbi:MbtH family protein [Streptomyces shenzhenensis]|uniref:MbtH family protein n=1 Tax=Streptomyces shenzhenensis TaxID=943815 RepID=UPI00368D33B7
MVNALDVSDANFVVLVNDEGQHSLWPAVCEIPAGWHITYGQATREACLVYIEENWKDMRPNSLVRATQGL